MRVRKNPFRWITKMGLVIALDAKHNQNATGIYAAQWVIMGESATWLGWRLTRVEYMAGLSKAAVGPR